MEQVLQIGQNLEIAIENLLNDELVAIPTETVYGLAGNALSELAVCRIYEAKNRPSYDPLIIHVDSIQKIENYSINFPSEARELAEKFWPGPLTLLLPKRSIVSDWVTAGNDLVAIRIPNHPITLQLLSKLPFPLAAPSANPFGYISPTKPEHVQKQLGDKVSYILDGGECKIGLESTIVGFDSDGVPVIYRLGGISVEQIEAVVGQVRIRPNQSSNPKAPGMLKSHYAPRTPIQLVDIAEWLQTHPERNHFALLSFQKYYPLIPLSKQRVLSPQGDVNEAARNLFSYLRELDELEVDIIFAELVPNIGLGKAINDRLIRAAAK
ncbi:MAG: L-threonylcarbamoyladenylate synthase [Bacteroidia bacterium]|nr:L-threonylcarbamoyladenylate synthase [Bacteroidia bacterium]